MAGDVIELNFSCPSNELSSSNQYVFISKSNVDISFALSTSGAYVHTGFSSLKVDGLIINSSSTKYSTDGKLKSLIGVFGVSGDIGYIARFFTSGAYYSGIISDFKITRAGEVIYSLQLRGNAIEGVNITKDPEFTWSENFTLGLGWSISENSAFGVAGSQSELISNLSSPLENNELVRVVIDATVNAGSLTIQNSNHPTLTTSGIYDNSATMTSNTNQLSIQKSSDFSGFIKNLTVIKGDTSANDGTLNGSPSTNFDRHWQQSDGNQQIKKTAGTIKLNDTKLALDSSNTYTIQSTANASYGDEIVVVRSGDNEPTLVLDSTDIADGKLIEYDFQTDTELTIDTNDTYTLFFSGVNLQVRRG